MNGRALSILGLFRNRQKARKLGLQYDLKTDFYRALLNRDEEEALAQVHRIMQNAVRDLSFYGT